MKKTLALAAARRKGSSGTGASELDFMRKENPSDEEYAVELKGLLYVGPAERTAIKVREAKHFKDTGHLNVCSLTNDDGIVTESEMKAVTPFKMSPKTIEDPEMYTERIVSFLQKYAETREGLILSVAEIACDFIKDDNNKWWFIQVISPSALLFYS
jgi:hypothetical protein